MSSQVTICNLALGWLGAERITAFDDDSVEAAACRDNYPETMESVLGDRVWTFCDARLMLTDRVVDEWGVAWKYRIPDDAGVLRVYRVYQDVSGTPPVQADWSREGDFIIAKHDGTCYCKAQLKIEDPDQWGATFRAALAARLAADMAIQLTRSAKIQTQMYNMYLTKLDDANAEDAGQGRNEQIISNRLIKARSGSLSNSGGW